MNPLESAVNQVGWSALSKALGVTHQAIRKWLQAGRLPRSEFSGETSYADLIEHETGGKARASDLLEWSRKGWNTKAA